MDYQVLSIEQMKELESLGINTSDSSCMWTSIQDGDYNPVTWLPVWRGPEAKTLEEMREAFPLTFKEGNAYYAYTLQDILEMLPKECSLIKDERCTGVCYYFYYKKEKIIGSPSIKLAAFLMLKWCKQYNKI